MSGLRGPRQVWEGHCQIVRGHNGPGIRAVESTHLEPDSNLNLKIDSRAKLPTLADSGFDSDSAALPGKAPTKAGRAHVGLEGPTPGLGWPLPNCEGR